MKTTKPENFRKWLDALRSGKYNQTHGALYRRAVSEYDENPNVGFCCLGVVCDISHLGKWVSQVSLTAQAQEMTYVVDGYQHPGYLTEPVMRWLGLDPYEADDMGELIYDSEAGHGFTLVVHEGGMLVQVNTLNDNGKDFKYIADLLEKEYL